MDVPARLRDRKDLWSGEFNFRGLVVSLAASILSLTGVLGLLVAARRVTGLTPAALDAAQLAAFAVLLAMSIAVARWLLLAAGPSSRRAAVGWWTACALISLIWACVLSLPGSSDVGLASLWSVLIGNEAAGWHWLLQHGKLGDDRPARSSPNRLMEAEVSTPRALAATPRLDTSDETLQSWVRSRSDDGQEIIEGTARVDLAAGQRHATVHLAICPAWPAEPQCFVEQTEGPAAELKVSETHSFGVRVDVRLDAIPGDHVAVRFEFSILDRAATAETDSGDGAPAGYRGA